MKTWIGRGLLALALLIPVACKDKSTGPEEEGCVVDESYDPAIVPTNFVATVDNPLWPLVPGTQFIFAGGGETVTVTVTVDTKAILGVATVVVHDVVMVSGELMEDTYDWYAQDVAGNVWYFGEDTKEYANGQVVSTEGSWEAGVDGAKAGIVMHAVQPPVGVPYRQEYYACEAEDYASVVATGQSVTVPLGTYADCLQTREFTPLDPESNEYKYYAAGIGLVVEVDVASGARVELIQIIAP